MSSKEIMHMYIFDADVDETQCGITIDSDVENANELTDVVYTNDHMAVTCKHCLEDRLEEINLYFEEYEEELEESQERADDIEAEKAIFETEKVEISELLTKLQTEEVTGN